MASDVSFTDMYKAGVVPGVVRLFVPSKFACAPYLAVRTHASMTGHTSDDHDDVYWH
jgi:hypothetical protein